MSEINKAAETEAVDNKGKKAKKKVKRCFIIFQITVFTPAKIRISVYLCKLI